MKTLLLGRSALVSPQTRMAQGTANAYAEAMFTLLGSSRKRR